MEEIWHQKDSTHKWRSSSSGPKGQDVFKNTGMWVMNTHWSHSSPTGPCFSLVPYRWATYHNTGSSVTVPCLTLGISSHLPFESVNHFYCCFDLWSTCWCVTVRGTEVIHLVMTFNSVQKKRNRCMETTVTQTQIQCKTVLLNKSPYNVTSLK